MARSEYIKTQMATFYSTKALYMSFHQSDPGLTGAGEIAGLARVAVTWVSLGGGRLDAQPMPVLIPAGTSLTHVGFWTTATGGTYVDSVTHVAEFPTEGTHTFVPSYLQP